MSNQSAQLAEKQEQGIDQILSDIKEVITTKTAAPQEEVLELTEVIEEVKAANESKPAVSETSQPQQQAAPVASSTFESISKAENTAPKDILATIDSAANKNQNISQAAAMPSPIQSNSFIPTSSFTSANSGTVDTIISDAVAATSRQTLKNFMKMTEKNDIDTLKLRSGNTVEDIIIELIKPQLSDWLNKNLPSLVASVVEKEIKKLVPKDE